MVNKPACGDALALIVGAAMLELGDAPSGRDKLCRAVGYAINGNHEHAWDTWSEPYMTNSGNYWQDRRCLRCGENQTEPWGK